MKKLLLVPMAALLLGACSNDADSGEKSEGHEEGHTHEAESTEDSHDHASVLNMDFAYENEEISVNLTEGGDAYEADRVRFEVVHPENDDSTVWLNTEYQGEGMYSADASDLETGKYEVVIHVNGPEELHEHTSKSIDVE